ncbi:hypothetical protein GXW83_03030 [Streptacidiphilus sp. PB12-B1b]|uniref:hypothetical protein n=1 Tax=Streptacidiphilus sp. PB12-B1b TaxID=2705012 RepID=UPI0015FAD7D9|nr:hypothetical protein [Streptacidiphilus sp. PB12-B1b]QMU74891.1 hypothetical protein GXW83_03030 [Streptacidiphilus sp. PB12-B1b]
MNTAAHRTAQGTAGRTAATERTGSGRIARRIGSAAAVAAVAAAVVGLGAGPASAKSAIAVGVGSRVVTVGRSVEVSASGDSDDFGGTPIQLCVDERSGAGAWAQLGCVQHSSVRLAVRAGHRGELQFRAQLVAVVNPRHRVVDRTSNTVAVLVH